MDVSSGDGEIFGVTERVTEATGRYTFEILTRSKFRSLETKQRRRSCHLKTTDIQIGNRSLKIAVCNGIAFARGFLESRKLLHCPCIEAMACRNGCMVHSVQIIVSH
jgi:iron only hydrogenase large subunit-like protein